MTLAEHLRGRRFGVALSSAFFGFYAHNGFARAFERAGLQPALWGGASAGALVAAFAAADALDALDEVLGTLRRKDFWDPAPSRRRPVGLLKGAQFAALIDRHLPVPTFEACRTPLLTVSTSLSRRSRHIDTQGPLAPAVLASCALPVLFRPIMREGELHLDGGLFDKAPLRAMVRHAELDALVVHLIPSSGLRKPVARAPWKFLDQALDWVRADSFQLQAELAEALGVEVYVIEQAPPKEARPNPFRLDRGAAAMAWGQRGAERALAGPAQAHRFAQ